MGCRKGEGRRSCDVLVRLDRDVGDRRQHCSARGQPPAGACDAAYLAGACLARAVMRHPVLRLAASGILPAMSRLPRLAAAVLAIASTGAIAGGELGGADEHPDEGLVFFGFVKDARGAPIPGAKVTATMKSGNTFIVQTSATGLYRLPTFTYQINPADVVIACTKEGYKQTR